MPGKEKKSQAFSRCCSLRAMPPTGLRVSLLLVVEKRVGVLFSGLEKVQALLDLG